VTYLTLYSAAPADDTQAVKESGVFPGGLVIVAVAVIALVVVSS
jgi:hypothetical protein